MVVYFARNIKYLRAKKGLSQNKLAQLANVNQSTIKRWEEDSISPSIDNVNSIAKVFNLPISDLIEKDLISDELKKDNFEIEEDFIIMPKDYKKYKKGDKVPVNEVLEYVDEMQNKIDKIWENLK